MPLELQKPNRTIRPGGMCLYGPGGAGKTTMLGTMPGKGLVVDIPQVEGGTFVLSDKADRIDITTVESWDEIEHVYWSLQRKEYPFNWVAIDSVTAMQELAKRKVVAERDLAAPPHKISLQEWGQIGQLVAELVYKFRTLPVWTIWIAQERRFGSPDDDIAGVGTQIGPDIIPSALAALRPSMMMVARLSVAGDGETRLLRTGPPTGSFIVKCRALPGKRMPQVIQHPSFNVILRYLLGDGPQPEEYDMNSAGIILA